MSAVAIDHCRFNTSIGRFGLGVGLMTSTNEQSILNGDVLCAEFHGLYRSCIDLNRKKAKKKKSKKKIKQIKGKDKQKSQVDGAGESTPAQPPVVELCSNPSSFAVFAGVRQSVLEKHIRDAAQIFLVANTCHLSDSENDEECNEDEKSIETLQRIPKIVGIGLCSVFELIRESRTSHPSLCTLALEALLDILQGQQPEGLKTEPADVIDSFFNLLLELASQPLTENKKNAGSSCLTSVACSCLLSLVVARGDTGKLLNATAAMIMSDKILAAEPLKMPYILTALQRSIHAVLLGKTVIPDWITNGILKTSQIDEFSLDILEENSTLGNNAMASDGCYLYMHLSPGNLLKFGTGYGMTIRGHLYAQRTNFYPNDKGWLGIAEGRLFYKPENSYTAVIILDTSSLKEIEEVCLELNGKEVGPSVMFSDGENIGTISSAKDDSFVVRTFNTRANQMPCISELPLKLARKCLDLFGWAAFDEERNLPNGVYFEATTFDDEPVMISAGKEFALLRTTSGKVLFSGKAQSLGIKQGGPTTCHWVELPITKSPKIVQFSVGHEGLHALLVAEDGGVFFVGLARRGEDGDQNKGRRQPKPVKPKKMIKVEALNIVYTACNNGTSALITKDGELYMFGKDTAHCHHSTGLVADLKDVTLTQVALGKAHVIALSNKGHVYTFGINNKGQCGRDFASHAKDAVMSVAMATANEDEGEDEELDTDEPDVMCPPGQHKWRQDECMVCTICGECTGFGGSCISKGQPDRNPGLPCGCGWGDSGCAECGCCKTCAGEEKVVGSILAAEFDIIMRRRPGNRLQDQIQKKLEERRHRHKAKTSNKSLKAHVKNIRAHVVETPQEKGMVPSLVEEIVSSDQEKEASKIASLAPARVTIPGDYTVSQIACGLHHSVLLLQNGEVFTFGSNQHGQLGVGDLTPRGIPSHVRLPSVAIHIAAGSNHTVILTSAGLVYTFGSYQKGQLGRSPPPQSYPEESRKEKFREAPWFSLPGQVPNIGPKYGRRPTWVGASGDQTFLKIDESLINAHNLTHSTVVANKNSICLIPNTTSSFKCLLINKGDGNCRNYSNDEQVDLSNHCVCIDPAYNVIWSLNHISKQVNCYNVVAAEACSPSFYNPIGAKHNSLSKLSQDTSVLPRVPHILTPMLATPIYPRYQVTRSQVALHLLSCLDTLAMAQELHWKVQEDEVDHQCVMKVYNKDDFATVNRFESHGGGWGYSGHSVEAIRFMADSDILLGGFGLFGGRGDYIGKIKLFDIGMEGGEQEIDGELVAETDEVPYECGARQRYPILFDEPIPLQANRWYVAWARVSGPSSDCGSSGQCVVTTEDQVAFYFKGSKKSNNGTDVNAGQIPQLLYKVVTHESQATHYRSDVCEPVYVLSREFSMSVSPDCLHSLLLLLDWSWVTFKTSLSKLLLNQDLTALHLAAVLDLDRLVYISCSTLRLLRTYINEVYPNNVAKKNVPEGTKLVESVIDTRSLLRRILSDPLPLATPSKSTNNHIHKPAKEVIHEMSTVVGKAMTILEECHVTFVACFHAFYPTPVLKWLCLCDLLVAMESDPIKAEGCDRLLAAILASLCCPTVKLTSILPIVWERDDSSPHKQNSLAGTNLEMSGTDMVETKYPLLVEHMLHKSRVEDGFKAPYMFQEVLNCLLAIVVRPIQHALGYEKTAPSSKLVFNTCRLLAATVAELAAQSIGLDADLHNSSGRVLHITSSRFTRVSQSRTWNTGNGSPDAICFSVDRPGIVIVGATLYGGVGSYDYELELLDDQNGSSSDPSHTQRWNSLEIVRGTFGPDDCLGDVVEVKFEHPVHIKENVKYALRLRNHGGRTSNGDGGLNSIKGPDGTTFSFSTCSLSFNGTNHTRGQLPQLLYYSTPQDSDNQQTNRALLELQARKNALLIASSVVKVATTLLLQARDEADEKVMEVLATAHVTSMLLPMIFAHIAPLATSDPRSAVQVLEMIQSVLPPVAYLNNSLSRIKTPPVLTNESTTHDINLCTTSNHYAIVESDHPYKPATVSNYKVCFPDTVKWMSLEFDPQCGTAQAEDALQLYIPSHEGLHKAALSSRAQDDEEGLESPYWPVLHKYSGNGNWPKCSLVLPGNEVVFSLETASDYVKDDKACFYGFKCLVVGYDCARIFDEGLRRLEEELAYLGGMCSSSLIRKDLLLPPASVDEMEDDLDIVDDIAQQIYNAHSSILGKGFALSHPPSIHQALEGTLPFSYLSNERSFLKDFVVCAPGTSGGRLARWLQPDSYIDMKHCEILYNKDEMRCGWPTVVTIVTKDQYEEIVNVPQLKLEVKAIPIDKRDHSIEDTNRKVPRMSKPDSLTFGGNPLPNITVPYEVTVKEKMCYYAISMMKSYENYSFEELRYTTPALKRPSENMMVRANNDGTYSCNWTPGSVGWYLIHVCIDGFEIENSRKIEVKEPPQGVTPPLQTLVKKNAHQPNKVKRFVAKFSAGLRVRAHSSLQSEQIGIVPVNGIITFIDEVHNDDGVWVRLSPDAIKKYCHNGHHEAWCLQYNQHLGRTLLVPLEEPKAFLDDTHKDNRIRHISGNASEDTRRQRTGGPGIYHVIKCGASGHNIRSTPNLKAPPVGMLVLGNQLNVIEEIVNPEGLWVKLDKDSMRRFCFNTDGEAWSLAQSRGDVIYLQHENNLTNQENDTDSANKSNAINTNAALNAVNEGSNKGFWTNTNPVDAPFDFSSSVQNPIIPSFGSNDSLGIFMFGPSNNETVIPRNSFNQKPEPSTFVFGQSSVLGCFSKLSSQTTPPTPPLVPPKPTVPERRHLTTPHAKSSVVQKWLRNDESRDQHHTSRESIVPPELLGVSVKELVKVLGESRANGNEATPPHTPPGTPPRRLSHSSSPKPTVPGVKRDSSPIPIPPDPKVGSGIPGDSVSASSSTRSSSNSPQLNCNFATTETTSSQSQHDLTQMEQSSNISSLRRTVTVVELSEGGCKSFTQTGTQTSPDGSKEHFSIGTNARKEESIRVSPKLSRKDRAARQLRSKRERAQSPAPGAREPAMKEHHTKEPVKTAMSPLVAECLRAVFSAFLWHEGIVHDAMACASFLKFHPDLPKQLPKVPKHDLTFERPETLSKEQKARLRHSVEVSASNFLTVQSNTAQALARSLANANVNKNKLPKPADTIKEESTFNASSENKGAVDTLRKLKSDDKSVTSSSTTIPLMAVQSPAGNTELWTVERRSKGDLPPSLQHLLVLWEVLTSEILKMMSQQLTAPVITVPTRALKTSDGKDKESDRRLRKKKEWRLPSVGRGNLFGEAAGGPFGAPERETMCELCGKFYPHPVTYHMRQVHPGCGGYAGGKGYSSGGNFCGGWAGNCGDGGVGGNSWYLICDRCREKYLRQKRQIILKEKTRRNRKKLSVGKLLSPLPPMETHHIMKQNAMFLLDLASASGAGMTSHPILPMKRSSHNGSTSVGGNMPSLHEDTPLEPSPFPLGSFQCLWTLGAQHMDLNSFSDNFLLEETLRQNRELGSRAKVRSNEDGGVVTLHSLAETDDSDTASNYGSEMLGISDKESSRGRVFHRSISVGTTTREWNREEGEGRIIMTRKRNKSSGEGIEDGSSLLCHPSSILTRLVSLVNDKANSGEILARPILSFILQRHDLQSLRVSMKQAVRKAACRAYAMQGLNWLLRSVTQPTALHDLLWFFVAALSPQPDPGDDVEDDDGGKAGSGVGPAVSGAASAVGNSGDKKERRDHDHQQQQEKEVAVCDHPLSDITIAGEAVRPLVTAFHSLLQSISDLMMMLPMGSALQMMAMRCWCLKFRQSDHLFLHRSHVFSNISKILSRSEEELCGDGDGMSSMGDSYQSTSIVECLKDLTSMVDLKASSRPGMLGSLLDNSTETFWESGDDDRNKTKTLTVMCSPTSIPKIIYVHIDNCRDLGNKVSNIVFKAGSHIDELVKLRQIEVESRYTGWVSCPFTDVRLSVIRLELKGPDNTLRVRQVKVLGAVENESLQVGKAHSAFVIQQRNCEAETLKVFRLLTSQVFGKLISSDDAEKEADGVSVNREIHLYEDKAEGNNDLKEHMVGILFSRSKLTHLQKQVCAHIVQAIRKEAARVREEWEALLCSKSLSMEELPKSSDAYCFEMLSMVLALSGSSVGRAYLAQQCSLLKDLLSLLHTGSARVQRQVTSLLRRVLPEVSPQMFAQILGVRSLPPADYSIVSEAIRSPENNESCFDIHRMGILDVFFSCIAKALTVQMKVKGKETNKGITTVTLATSIHPRDYMGSRWWLRGCITRKLAEVIIQLLQDMASGKLSEAWASVTKGAVAENILNLTRLEDRCRSPSDCLKTATLWLALASLCVLDQDHVERLSSGQWSAGSGDGQQATARPTCDNHDDGETLAIILCNSCGNLCADCDRYLHLHRRTHSHQRQVFKEEEEAIKVDLHEGCGRTKLFWIMALADSKTLKAMVEFREGTKGKSAVASAGTCRFCGTVGDTGLLAIGNVCGDSECQEHARSACIKSLPCGHMCGGIRNELVCLPCLHGCSHDLSLKQDADDMCMICFTEALSCAPALQLRCGHIFHLHCCHNVLTKRWAGPRITFGFSLCPICKCTIDHLVLKELLDPIRALYDDVRRKALMRLEYEGLHKADAIATPGARFFNDPASYAMERYAYYVCYKCKKAYYGGEARCDIEAGGGDDYDPTELVCGACSDVSRAQMCPKHGTDFLEYKCRYCCSVAVFFCFGTTHFCNACHDDFQHVTNIPKNDLPHCPAGPKGKQLEGEECPLHVQHPPTGEEFALGCGVCRNAHTF